MEEADIERVLAVAAPDTVPTVAGLAERARASGRRQRRRRAAMTSGGAGIALAGVVGAVVTLGGFGAGQSARVSSDPEFRAGGGSGTPVPVTPRTTAGSRPSSAAPSSSLPPTKPTSPKGQMKNDPVADAEVLAALKAALPTEDQDKPTLFRGSETPGSYGAEYNWGPRSQQSVLGLSVGAISPVTGTPTMCQSDMAHCTVGTATLHGDPVTWQYYYGDLNSPSLNVYDNKAMVNYLVTADGPNTSRLPGLTEMKDIGLNDQLAAALLAAWQPRQ